MAGKQLLLIVDDDAVVCRLLAGVLRKQGFAVEWCLTGEEALQRLRRNETALLLLDLHLPDMRGQDVMEILGREGVTVPYIVVSGVDDVRVAVELMRLGALDFLQKDGQLVQLVVPVVRRCLERLSQQRQLEEVERRFLQLAANIQSVFWISGPDMRDFLYMSPAYEQIWGRPVQSVYEHSDSWKEAVLSADLLSLESALQRLTRGAEHMEIEYRIVRPDGDIRWLYCTASPLLDSAGSVDRLTGFMHDITERKEINRRLLAVADQERRRMGADLHDDLCQRLAAIKLRCGLLERSLRQEGSRFTSTAEELVAAIGDATSLSRNLARGLAPVALDTEGLVGALDNLAESTSRIFGVPVSFECPADVSPTDPDTATHFYRIAQELISNAAKHAAPTFIRMRLEQAAAYLTLEVTNDGIPFQGEPGREKNGMGLHLLRSRADALGGTLEFQSGAEQGEGTRILCVVPCH